MMPPPCDDDSGEICDLDMPELVSDVPETTSVSRPVVYTDVTEAFLAGSSGGFVTIYTGKMDFVGSNTLMRVSLTFGPV